MRATNALVMLKFRSLTTNLIETEGATFQAIDGATIGEAIIDGAWGRINQS